MGQNCIAGTTEYDEENGIGLVMYVESGSNMIVWKMSDGTKQGTTVPVSSEYQNMLRTAFQNKTGKTIGYFIFHPYTEETIDIESSITINSGDTPTKTLVAVKQGPMYAFGELVGNEVVFECKAQDTPWVADSDGKISGEVTGQFPGVFTYVWKSKIDEALGIDSSAGQIIIGYQYGDQVQNWDSYIKID